MKRKEIVVFLSAILMCASMLYAQDDPAAEGGGNVNVPGWYLNTNFGSSINYLGLAVKGEIYYRMPLINDSGMLWKSTKLDLGVQEYLSPTYTRTSAFVKIEPIAFFDLAAYAGYDYMYKIGDSDLIATGFIPMASPSAEYDSDARKLIEGTSKGGFRGSVIPTLKMALGPVAALYSFELEYHDYNYSGYYYDPSTFIIHKGSDILYRNDVKVLYKLGPYGTIGTFRVGVNWNDCWIDSSEKHSMKLAAMAIYTPAWASLDSTTQPYFVLLAGSHLQDKYNEGKPYIALLAGVSFKIF